MRKAIVTSLMIMSGMWVAGEVTAQAPAAPAPAAAAPSAGGTADGMPFDIPYGTPVGLDMAQEGDRRRRGRGGQAPLEDEHRGRRHARRSRSTSRAWTARSSRPFAISQGKARTAARFRRESRVFYNAYETGHPYVSTLDPTLVASPGGYPLIEGGKLIGAVGCSGGTGDQDAAACKAGADLVK